MTNIVLTCSQRMTLLHDDSWHGTIFLQVPARQGDKNLSRRCKSNGTCPSKPTSFLLWEASCFACSGAQHPTIINPNTSLSNWRTPGSARAAPEVPFVLESRSPTYYKFLTRGAVHFSAPCLLAALWLDCSRWPSGLGPLSTNEQSLRAGFRCAGDFS